MAVHATDLLAWAGRIGEASAGLAVTNHKIPPGSRDGRRSMLVSRVMTAQPECEQTRRDTSASRETGIDATGMLIRGSVINLSHPTAGHGVCHKNTLEARTYRERLTDLRHKEAPVAVDWQHVLRDGGQAYGLRPESSQ